MTEFIRIVKCRDSSACGGEGGGREGLSSFADRGLRRINKCSHPAGGGSDAAVLLGFFLYETHTQTYRAAAMPHNHGHRVPSQENCTNAKIHMLCTIYIHCTRAVSRNRTTKYMAADVISTKSLTNETSRHLIRSLDPRTSPRVYRYISSSRKVFALKSATLLSGH